MPGSPPRSSGLASRRPPRQSVPRSRLRVGLVALVAVVALAAPLGACVPAASAGQLKPTLTTTAVRGGEVAMQDGMPVPSFGFQGRPRIDLNGSWRVDRQVFDSDLSLTPREASLEGIVNDAAGREKPQFDDSTWQEVDVPGALNLPPDRREVGGWYRRSFFIPSTWTGQAVSLKFGAVNYLADVWLNGTWLGYHEGGSTPFAFDATAAARPGRRNVVVVRVDNPAWGSRNDIVPWGLADWWNFGGLIRPVWLEAANPVQVVRADVVPHLDGADVSVVVRNAGPSTVSPGLTVEVYPARSATGNLLDPDPRRLIPTRSSAVVTQDLDAGQLNPGDVARIDGGFLIAGAETWSPLTPNLYVLRVTLSNEGRPTDVLHELFGLRQVTVDPSRPAVDLNGRAVVLPGVAVHDQELVESAGGAVTGHLPAPSEVLDALERARSVGARLLRPGHAPPNPVLLDLADRLGLAVWEEIPLYHYTPQTFGIAMARGIPQQMLREMALRDMNHPSVLFHGLANESTGDDDRQRALTELRDVDRGIDGTRLTGQAAYGFTPSDSTSAPLDVAGYTFYHGVFYGTDPSGNTAAALETAHETYPDKPLMILEFGTWADGVNRLSEQRRIFSETSTQLFGQRATRPGGYVSGAIWWALEDYATLRPTIEVERFGLFGPGGKARPVAADVRASFADVPLGLEDIPVIPIVPSSRGLPAASNQSGLRLLAYIGFGFASALTTLTVAFALLVRRGGRSGHPWPTIRWHRL
jgi:beta-glucuronidase